MVTISHVSISSQEVPVQDDTPLTFEQLYEEHYPRIRRYVRSFGWQPETTEDVLQVIFFKVWRGLPNLGPDAYYAGWIARIAKNECINEIRRCHRVHLCLADPLDEWHATNITAPDELSDVERRECASYALSHLPACDVFLLYQIARGYKFGEVAVMLGIREDACKSRVWRARQVLHKALREQEIAS